LQRRSDDLRSTLEIIVGQSAILAVAVGFDETEMILPLVQSGTKRIAKG
jgi:hypothetical protein